MTDHKKSSIALWATAVIVVLVMSPFVYMASLGPLYFLAANGTIDQQTSELLVLPAMHLGSQTGYWPDWFWNRCEAYVEWWGELAE